MSTPTLGHCTQPLGQLRGSVACLENKEEPLVEMLGVWCAQDAGQQACRPFSTACLESCGPPGSDRLPRASPCPGSSFIPEHWPVSSIFPAAFCFSAHPFARRRNPFLPAIRDSAFLCPSWDIQGMAPAAGTGMGGWERDGLRCLSQELEWRVHPDLVLFNLSESSRLRGQLLLSTHFTELETKPKAGRVSRGLIAERTKPGRT